MKVTVRVTLQADDDTPAVVCEVFTLERRALASDTLGLHVDEAKDLLRAVQSAIVEEQVRGALKARVGCPCCGKARRHKDAREIVVRSLFGTLRLPSPRWWHCSCAIHQTRTFSPLAALIAERTTPELRYLEAKFAGLVSYGLSAKLLAELLAELLPLGRPLHATAVRLHAKRFRSVSRTNSAASGGASSTAAQQHGRTCRARTCRSSSASTAATSTAASSALAATAGLR